MNAQETAVQIYKELFTAEGQRLKNAIEKRKRGEHLTREEIRLIVDAAIARASSTNGERETRDGANLAEVMRELEKLLEEGAEE